MKSLLTISLLLLPHLLPAQQCVWLNQEAEQPALFATNGRQTGATTIAVAVHVVYASDEQNISDRQILSQIEALNSSVNNLPPNSAEQSPGAFVFGLAAEDEHGAASTGITRTSTEHRPFGNLDFKSTEKGGKDAWNPEKFLNIWVCDLGGETLGMTGSPQGSAGFDGIAIDYEAFGKGGSAKYPHHLGKTLVHEMGHYFGLKHLEGDMGGCDDDDGIADTPVQAGKIDACDTLYFSCGSYDMVNNFMSYAPDECLLYFTEGQKKAMHEYYETHRSKLSDKIRKELITEVPDGSAADHLAYPNPFHDRLCITAQSYELYHINGSLALRGHKKVIDTRDLKKGTYLIKIFDREKVTVKKLVKI